MGTAHASPMPDPKRMLLIASLTGLVLIACLVIGRNISIKRSLRREKNRFETLYESLPTPVAQISWSHGRPTVVSANEAFEVVFGNNGDDQLGFALQDSIPAEDLAHRVEGNGLRNGTASEPEFTTEVTRNTHRGTRTFQLNVAGRVRNGETREIYVIYSITQGLIDTIGGEIDVESEKGVGTRFTIRLPRRTPD